MSTLSARLGWLTIGCTRLLDAVSALLAAAITTLVVAQVIVRYILGGSLVWSEELTRLLFIWMVLLATTNAVPMRIDVLVGIVSRRIGTLLKLFGECVVFALTCYLVWGAWGMADLTANDTYTALGISVSWAYFALFVSGLLWLSKSLLCAGAYASELVRPADKSP